MDLGSFRTDHDTTSGGQSLRFAVSASFHIIKLLYRRLTRVESAAPFSQSEWMSFSFKFPEPHDARVRAAALQRQQSLSSRARDIDVAHAAQSAPDARSKIMAMVDSLPLSRSQRQFGLFAAGATFFAASAFITRRALVRKYLEFKPAGHFTPSNKVPDVNGGIEAAEALYLATINVTSAAMMFGGGALWAMDVSTVDDLRRKLRSRLDLDDGGDKTHQEAEEDIEEWMAYALAKMQGKSDLDITDLVKQAALKEAEKESAKAEVPRA